MIVVSQEEVITEESINKLLEKGECFYVNFECDVYREESEC